MQIMKESRSMCDGHLGKISEMTHSINLGQPDAAPIHAAPYRAGPRQRNLEREEVDQMIKASFAEPATTE